MSDSSRPFVIKGLPVLIGLVSVVFAIGAVIGYVDGLSGDGGSAERATQWAIRTGLLLLGMTIVIGIMGGAVISRANLHPSVVWAIVMGTAFAVMQGGGVLLGMDDRTFVSRTVSGLFSGAIVGAIVGLLNARSQKRRLHAEDTSKTDKPV